MKVRVKLRGPRRWVFHCVPHQLRVILSPPGHGAAPYWDIRVEGCVRYRGDGSWLFASPKWHVAVSDNLRLHVLFGSASDYFLNVNNARLERALRRLAEKCRWLADKFYVAEMLQRRCV